ncbi:hypothetical protein IPG41_00125 [Candidatus Peregrinibacteria bacterium]|nr:MAG: hypothetical protein IPG41_00125 [Candidatus Peregrinibacteria bacterium]
MAMELPKQLTVKQSVLATLAYFDLFEVPLTREELSDYLLFQKPDERALDLYLKDSSYVMRREGFLSFHWNPEFWKEWEEKQARTRAAFAKVARWRWLFQLCPFVRLVAVCNSVTMGDTRKNSDIDLFVVAEPGRLFTARLALTLLTSLFGLRRHGQKIRERFCLSFYVTEEALDLSPLLLKPYDIYLGFWAQSLQPVAGDYSVYEDFIALNWPWLSTYFAAPVRRKRYFRASRGWVKLAHRLLEWLLDSDKVERWCREKQWGRALAKFHELEDKRGTVISDSMLKFHDKDARLEVREAWRAKVEKMI